MRFDYIGRAKDMPNIGDRIGRWVWNGQQWVGMSEPSSPPIPPVPPGPPPWYSPPPPGSPWPGRKPEGSS